MTKTNTQTLSTPKSNLTFNVFYDVDTTTLGFLQGIILKNPWEWSILRQLFEGKNSDITIVDKSIETPFQCMLAALFCKQLTEELGTETKKVRFVLTPIKKEQPGKLVTVNGQFDTTANRNDFLQDCFIRILGKRISIVTRRNPVYCRDLKIATVEGSLYIRCEGGIGHGWQLTNKYDAQLPGTELLQLHDSNMPCHNIFARGFSKTGHFISIELQPTKSLTSNL